MKPSQASQPSALVVVSCPELVGMTPAEDGTVPMGDAVTKLAEVAGQYRECRAAALGVGMTKWNE